VRARIARPLPECSLCEAPVKRDVHEANGGLCNGCTSGIADTVRMLPAGRGLVDIDKLRRQRLLERRPDLVDEDCQTVFVERFIPPVPGEDR
jgi:hypothetical protein